MESTCLGHQMSIDAANRHLEPTGHRPAIRPTACRPSGRNTAGYVERWKVTFSWPGPIASELQTIHLPDDGGE